MGRIDFNVDAADMRDILRMFDSVQNVPEKATAAITEGAEIILSAAKDLSPVREGNMKRDLKIGRRKKTQDKHAVEVGVFWPDSPYAHLVEGGHGGPKPASAHPFLEVAAEMKEREVIDAVMEALKRAIG